MLKKLRLVRFRAFADFTVHFSAGGAYLVGPNNAGKSTVLTALRTADVLLRHAHQRTASMSTQDGARSVTAYPLSLAAFPALQDSIRHEFADAEARMEVTWASAATLTAVWPADSPDEEATPFFYLDRLPGVAVRQPAQAKRDFPSLGVIPILSPVDQAEGLREPATVDRNVSGRLSSRHFRNQLRLLRERGQLDEFLTWAEPWLADLKFDGLGQHLAERELVLEAFILEEGSRVPKELAWAGDGIQVWLQLLFHVYRVRALETIVLDEPEVYLHPDLQRRLVRLLESTERQVILATHSAEMLSETDMRLVSLIDKRGRGSRKARNDGDLEMLSSTLGSAFNLRLARALRSRVALFVEGHDMVMLRRLAKTAGCTALEQETGVTVIELGGYSRWGQVEPFSWLCSELLPEALKVHVILDRDYRPDAEVENVEARFAAVGLAAHVWRRKELESYLLTPSVIARLAGNTIEQVTELLDDLTAKMENEVFSKLLSEKMRLDVSARNHEVSVMTAFKAEFDPLWRDPAFRLRHCPPKQVLAALNDHLQGVGHKAVSFSALARSHRVAEIDSEVLDTLRAVERAAEAS